MQMGRRAMGQEEEEEEEEEGEAEEVAPRQHGDVACLLWTTMMMTPLCGGFWHRRASSSTIT